MFSTSPSASRFILASVATAALALGCGSPKPRIVGKWAGTSTDKWEFFSDDTCVLQRSGSQGGSYQCKWAILDDGRVKIEIVGTIITGKLEAGKLVTEMQGTPNYHDVLQKQ